MEPGVAVAAHAVDAGLPGRRIGDVEDEQVVWGRRAADSVPTVVGELQAVEAQDGLEVVGRPGYAEVLGDRGAAAGSGRGHADPACDPECVAPGGQPTRPKGAVAAVHRHPVAGPTCHDGARDAAVPGGKAMQDGDLTTCVVRAFQLSNDWLRIVPPGFSGVNATRPRFPLYFVTDDAGFAESD